jgi:hypothetical protein
LGITNPTAPGICHRAGCKIKTGIKQKLDRHPSFCVMGFTAYLKVGDTSTVPSKERGHAKHPLSPTSN